LSGEVVGLLAALLWAVGSVLLTVGAKRLHVVPLNLVRCVVSTIFFWALLPLYGGFGALAGIPAVTWAWLAVSVLGLLVIGDTLYFRSLDLAGVSWAMPVANINPIWTVLLASLLVGEPLTWRLLAGALLVVAGIALLSRSPKKVGAGPVASEARQSARPLQASKPVVSNPHGHADPGAKDRRTGLLLALATSLLWAIGFIALKPGTADMHSVVANSIRQPMAMVMLLGLTLGQGRWRDLRRLDRRSWAIIIVASFIGTAVGTLLFIMAIQMAGSGRTAVLTAASPVMALPFSMLWLQERPTRWTILGTLLTVVGIGLVV
jgi:transporter family protein